MHKHYIISLEQLFKTFLLNTVIKIYVTHLHKTSHLVAKHKISENCILSKNVKKVLFFVFIKITFFGQDSFKIFVFYTILLVFSSIYGYFESSFK